MRLNWQAYENKDFGFENVHGEVDKYVKFATCLRASIFLFFSAKNVTVANISELSVSWNILFGSSFIPRIQSHLELIKQCAQYYCELFVITLSIDLYWILYLFSGRWISKEN